MGKKRSFCGKFGVRTKRTIPTLSCLIVGGLILYEGMETFPQIFKMVEGVSNKMTLWNFRILALKLGRLLKKWGRQI